MALLMEGVTLGDLAEREAWTGVALTEAETSDALDRLEHSHDEAASFIAGRILRMGKGKAEEGGDE